MKAVLFLLPHQDDECFVLPWIVRELQSGADVRCVFLSDGASRVDAGTRDAESLNALQSFGVERHRIHFLPERARDRELVFRLGEVASSAERWIRAQTAGVSRIYAPDWEGGHQDHDAAHLVALFIAQSFGALGETWGYPTYNAFRTPPPAFRTMRPLIAKESKDLHYGLGEAWAYATCCRFYRSQRRTWMGLFPESFLRRILFRRDRVNRASIERVRQRPHDGTLLYERMFDLSYGEFRAASEVFISGLTAPGPAQTNS